MNHLSRRDVLAVTAAAMSAPLIESALGTELRAYGQATGPATAQAGTWITTTLKPADLKNNEFTAVTGQRIMLSRKDKTVLAVSNVCTHNRCALRPQAAKDSIVCSCHNSTFNLEGGVTRPPANRPLDRYAIRVNTQGFIEVDPGKPVARDAQEATLTIAS